MNSGTNPMNQIRNAANNQLLVTINYTDSKGIMSERIVEPYEIKNGSLYAYCTDKESIRMFKISRINSAVCSSIKYVPRWPVNI